MEAAKQDNEIKALKSALEEALGMKVETPRHFDMLRKMVFNRTSEYISTSTLKRIWGYIGFSINTRTTTLSLLARTIGYKDWEDFRKRNEKGGGEKKIPSSPKFGRSINVKRDLKTGDTIKLYWNPGRKCTVNYLGNMKFEVLESEKTRLVAGTTFYCHLIVAGHPLYLSEVKIGTGDPCAYMCGKLHGGVQFEKPEDE